MSFNLVCLFIWQLEIFAEDLCAKQILNLTFSEDGTPNLQIIILSNDIFKVWFAVVFNLLIWSKYSFIIELTIYSLKRLQALIGNKLSQFFKFLNFMILCERHSLCLLLFSPLLWYGYLYLILDPLLLIGRYNISQVFKQTG